MNLRNALTRVTVLALIAAVEIFSPARGGAEGPLARICFGSCAKQSEPQPIWDAIVARKPELFVLLGDNIYADTRDMNVMKAKYAMLAAVPGFQKLRAACSLIATWDDHDYGINDSASHYNMKEQSREIFLDFFGEPKDSPRRKHPGVYTSYTYGPPGKRVQIILLDLRYFRTPNLTIPGKRQNFGPYSKDEDPNSTMLGDEQWAWLEEELKKPAEIRFIGSSIQFLADFHGVEAWAAMPLEREKMLKLIHSTRADGVIFLSGDVHWGEIARFDQEGAYPIFELTSSGLTHANAGALPSKQRIGRPLAKVNFGEIGIDWTAADPVIKLQVRDVNGAVAIEQTVALSSLKHPKG